MRNMSVKDQIIVSHANDIIRHRVYFGDNDPLVASVWGTGELQLFNAGQGDVVKNVTTGADVTMQKCDTSLFSSQGLIPKAQRFTVMAIGVDVHLSSIQANVPFSDDAVSQIDVNPVQVVNPYPLVEAVRSQGVFSLYRNATEFLEEGNVADYPCGLYQSGWGSDGSADVPAVTQGVAAGLQAAYSINGFLLAQNGMAFRPLSVWYELTELDQFHGRFEMQRPLLLTGSGLVGYVDFLLVGQADTDRKSRQQVQIFSR